MNNERRLVRQYRLQKFVRLLSGRFDVDVTLPEEEPEMFKSGLFKDKVPYYGFSDSEKNIFVNPNIDKDPYENLIQQKAVSLHELGHVIYTDGKLWLDSGVNQGLCNIIEDGRVEEAISRDYPKARKYFYHLNEKISKKGLIPKGIPQSTEILLADYMLRIAKMPTGMEPPSVKNIEKLKKKLKGDFNFFSDRTIKAVNANTEEEAIAYTKEIEERWIKVFGDKKRFPAVARTPFSSIAQKKSKRGKPMPPQLPSKKSKQQQMEQKIKKHIGKSKGDQPAYGGDKKSAKELHKELKDKAKKDLKKEIKEEYKSETKELNKGTVKGDFSSYDKITTKKARREPIYTTPLETLARRIHHKFKLIAQSGKGWQRNQPRGKIDSANLYKVPVSKNNSPKIFKAIKQKNKTDISVVILLDISGSMSGSCNTATQATYVIARALEMGDFNSEIVGFGTGYGGLMGIKSFNQSTFYSKKDFIPRSDGGTPLFIALEGAQKSLDRIDSKRKIIIVITDGQPNTGGGPEECKEKIKQIEKDGISVVGLLINIDDSEHIFHKKRSFRLDDVREIYQKMTMIIKNVLLTIER